MLGLNHVAPKCNEKHRKAPISTAFLFSSWGYYYIRRDSITPMKPQRIPTVTTNTGVDSPGITPDLSLGHTPAEGHTSAPVIPGHTPAGGHTSAPVIPGHTPAEGHTSAEGMTDKSQAGERGANQWSAIRNVENPDYVNPDESDALPGEGNELELEPQPTAESMTTKQLSIKVLTSNFLEIELDARTQAMSTHAYLVETLRDHRVSRGYAAQLTTQTETCAQLAEEVTRLKALNDDLEENVVELERQLNQARQQPRNAPPSIVPIAEVRPTPNEPSPAQELPDPLQNEASTHLLERVADLQTARNFMIAELNQAQVNLVNAQDELATALAERDEATQLAEKFMLDVQHHQQRSQPTIAPQPALAGPTARQMHDAYFSLTTKLCEFAAKNDQGFIRHTPKFFLEEAKRLYDQLIPKLPANHS